ncbi:nuclear transport factor 2 family protein [Carboxylicivirga caseinilyticus]|uniref:nuclear transport factor 2 family protein n=1 Tax=Carboxylicivirga caseinilyticus TaxID=3417572 RepID=UPI003D32EFF3|nr:nuclear transport factor 2 family protein [Marinilabiliaceae bacterium A049]
MKATHNEKIDLKIVQQEIHSLLDKFHEAFKTWDIETVSNMMSEEMLYMGTDQTEVVDKYGFIKDATEFARHLNQNLTYNIDKRIVRVYHDANSATSIEEFFEPLFSKTMSYRMTVNWILENDEWKMDFVNWGMITSNEQVMKIDEAMRNS